MFIRDINLYEVGHLQRIQLEIEIIPTNKYTATRQLTKASVNNKPMYDLSKPEVERFFPALTQGITDRQSSAEEILRYLINCYEVVHAKRFLQNEELTEIRDYEISSERFKSWLLGLSESREPEYTLFKGINERFTRRPFSFGEVRPIVENGEVNLIVRTDNGREFTIDRLGTGVQQILMLLSRILTRRTNIMGIEEVELNLSPSLQNKTLSVIKGIVADLELPKDQMFLTSHSSHLGSRQDAVLYAVKLDASGFTEVGRGPSAIADLKPHFDFGLFNQPKRKTWRD